MHRRGHFRAELAMHRFDADPDERDQRNDGDQARAHERAVGLLRAADVSHRAALDAPQHDHREDSEWIDESIRVSYGD